MISVPPTSMYALHLHSETHNKCRQKTLSFKLSELFLMEIIILWLFVFSFSHAFTPKHVERQETEKT